MWPRHKNMFINLICYIWLWHLFMSLFNFFLMRKEGLLLTSFIYLFLQYRLIRHANWFDNYYNYISYKFRNNFKNSQKRCLRLPTDGAWIVINGLWITGMLIANINLLHFPTSSFLIFTFWLTWRDCRDNICLGWMLWKLEFFGCLGLVF